MSWDPGVSVCDREGDFWALLQQADETGAERRVRAARGAQRRVPEGKNPCHRIVKYRKRKRERFLIEQEFHRLGKALAEAANGREVSLHAIAAIRLLLPTGCRKNEILTLKWNAINQEAGILNRSDSKTGSRLVPISSEAVEVLAGIPRPDGNPWVIPGKAGGRMNRTRASQQTDMSLEPFRV